MALAINALTSVAAVKSYLKIADTNTIDDTRIEGLINACSSAIENFCRRNFKKQTFTDEEYDGNDHRYLNLYNYPVQSVQSVTLNDELVDSIEYIVKKKTGILARKYNNTLSGISYNRYVPIWPKGDANILVTYTAGYDEIPADLEQACILYVMSFYKSDVANFSTTFTDGFVFRADAMPVQVKLMLQPYMKVY
jgi:uncharacterized phiE125 gp8 family phage protein